LQVENNWWLPWNAQFSFLMLVSFVCNHLCGLNSFASYLKSAIFLRCFSHSTYTFEIFYFWSNKFMFVHFSQIKLERIKSGGWFHGVCAKAANWRSTILNTNWNAILLTCTWDNEEKCDCKQCGHYCKWQKSAKSGNKLNLWSAFLKLI
jgi:hypothetical protein